MIDTQCANEKTKRCGGYVLMFHAIDRSRWHPCSLIWTGHKLHGKDKITEPYWIKKWGTDWCHWVMYLGPCLGGETRSRCYHPRLPWLGEKRRWMLHAKPCFQACAE